MDETNKDIFEYLNILLRRKWLVILPTLIFGGVSVYVAMNLPAIYRSTTLILVEGQKISSAYVTPTDVTPFEQRLSTIKQQVMSRTNLERIITDFQLYQADKEGKEPNLVGRILLKLGAAGDASKMSKEEMVETMRSDIVVDVMGGGRRGGGEAFRISYTGRDPYLTMQVTNTLASLFIEENLKIKEQYAEGTTEFLSRELEGAKLELEKQEDALRRFKERHVGALPSQLETNLRTLDRLQLELQAANESIKNSEDRKAMLEEQLNAPSASVDQAAPASSPEEELFRLENSLAALLSVYKENYPDVLLVRNRIKEIREHLAAEAGEGENKTEGSEDVSPMVRSSREFTELSTVKSRIAMLKNREAQIRRQIKAFEKRVEVTPANEQKLTDLKRDYDITLQNYQSLLEKKLSARLAENLEKKQKGARFRVVDPANLPEKPFKPDRKMVALTGTGIGVGAGVGLVFLLEFLNPAFRKPEDFEGVLDYPVLAVIPQFADKLNNPSGKRLQVIKGAKGKRA